MTDSPPVPNATAGLTWACVEDGFYVASNQNGFVGYIDRLSDDSFQVCTATSQQLAFFRDLTSAINCLAAVHTATRQEGALNDA